MIILQDLSELLKRYSDKIVKIENKCSSCWNALDEQMNSGDYENILIGLIDGVEVIIEDPDGCSDEAIISFNDEALNCSNKYDARDDNELSGCSNFQN